MVVSFCRYIKLCEDRQRVGGELDLNNYGFVRCICQRRREVDIVCKTEIIMIDSRTGGR